MELRPFLCMVALSCVTIISGSNPNCTEEQWQCDDGTCIRRSWRCDGGSDCVDGSDELKCLCGPGETECADGSGCVKMPLVCDGPAQCPDGSDKWMCTQNTGCLPGDWTCRNKLCIPLELRCNGRNDCGDDSDEEACGPCGDPRLRCPDGVCLTASERCDGITQCSDARDEPASCGKKCSERNGGCSHGCVDRPGGAECHCPAGMILSANGVNCEDLNECSQPYGPCQQLCLNTPGSFACHCRGGFKEQMNTCLAQGNATKLLTTRKGAIVLLNLRTRQIGNLYITDRDPVAITYDLARGTVYWADDQGRIFKGEGQKIRTLFQGQMGIGSLACDWLNGHVYWTSAKTQTVYAGSSDGKGVAVVMAKGGTPLDLVLLPTERNMFWINKGQNGELSIEKASMDGYRRSTLAIITAELPRGLTLDVAARRLYWISDFKMSIETVKCDGSGRYTFMDVFKGRTARALAVFEGLFYWADEKYLWQIDPKEPEKSNFVVKASSPHMAVYHSLQQPRDAPASCVASRCPLCLLSKVEPVGYTCACPKGLLSVSDGSCSYYKIVYATPTNIYMLEFAKKPPVKTLLLTTTEDIESFDISWRSGSIIWINGTGHLRGQWLSGGESVYIPTPGPVCLVRVDQQTGNLIWRSCDGFSIGVTAVSLSLPDHGYTKTLYESWRGVKDLYVDWKRGRLYWLEMACVHSMALGFSKGDAQNVFCMEGQSSGHLAFDRKSNAFLWNSMSGLQIVSLMKMNKYSLGQSWSVRGDIEAVSEPYIVSSAKNTITLWGRKDGARVTETRVEKGLVGVVVAELELMSGQTLTKASQEQSCKSPSVLCEGTSLCISQSQLCDGRRDCPDGADEKGCVKSCSNTADFLCKDRRKCIKRNLVCDGRSHCSDGSDEVGCPTVATKTSKTTPLKCRLGSKACRDGSDCVLLSHVCDGEKDCRDGSDEEECEQCQEGQFQCANGRKCIDQKQVCDGTPQCQDRSDELDCWVPTKSCTLRCDGQSRCIPQVFICNGVQDCWDASDEAGCAIPSPAPRCDSPSVLCEGTSLCITPGQLCDGKKDCPDGWDEKPCLGYCPKRGQYLCKDRRKCIEKRLICDGRSQCFDGSDEVGCPNVAINTLKTTPLKCPLGSKACQDGTECVLHSHVCDGEKDCRDGSDEEWCDLRCKPDQFQCAHGRMCIDQKQVCDGTPQCQDRSDELDCFKATKSCSHRCDNKTRCIPEGFLCDGEKDCSDGTDEANCGFPSPAPAPSPCRFPSVLCEGTSLCISQSQLCDGRRDCPDGADERGCLKSCSDRAHFLCKDKRKCIERNLVCDGRSHCSDGSDEVGCPTVATKTSKTTPLKCNLGSKACRDGSECVLHNHVCDGEKDCRDGSDEEACVLICTPGQFQCAHGSMCIDQKQVCDGTPQCQDRSDELNCLKTSKSCSHRCDQTRCIPENFLCDGQRDCQDGSDEANCQLKGDAMPMPAPSPCRFPSVLCEGTSLCISQSQLCDGRRDCPDGADERGCLKSCSDRAHFLCKDKRKCIERSLVCDGRSHCSDGSDEVGCPTVATKTLKTTPLKCRLGSKACRDGTECVLHSHVCDGEKDCSDGSDEEGCVLICTPDQFQCAHGSMCIAQKQVCDGTPQCQDRSDELNCLKTSKSCSHRCDQTRCIPENFLCDGQRDCQDGSDEANCQLKGDAMPMPTPSPCRFPSVLCEGTSLCISQNQLCDGRRDCPDGADERGCLKSCSDSGHFLCKDRRKCIERNLVCDGRSHCSDGSDEVGCPTVATKTLKTTPLKCRLGSKACRDGTECVLHSHVCDGEKDCRDGSDEDECDPVCKPDQFQCFHGSRCIDQTQVCDGTPQCQDRSDELDCFQATQSCSHRCDEKTRCLPQTFVCDGERDCLDGTDEANCGESTGPPGATVLTLASTTTSPCRFPSVLCEGTSLCISQSQLCDGRRDCPDGADERDCLNSCSDPGHFLCKDKRKCIERSLVCDGRSHCFDGSDEVGCPTVSTNTLKTTPLKCRLGSKACRDGSECVLHSHVCDGEKDCRDGSDEDECDLVCKPGQFQCAHGRMCIDQTQVCDGTPQCQDRSDELDCFKATKSCSHRCDDKTRCVPENFLCDGEEDCLDGTDEANCSLTTPAPTPSPCRFPSVLCEGTSLCISQSQLCDGRRDCPDGADERDCVDTCSDPAHFLCEDRRKCIERNLVCDGRSHCPDGSDEKKCPKQPSSCDRTCDGGTKCLSQPQICDGTRHCQDGQDERNCPGYKSRWTTAAPLRCRLGSKACRDGTECVLYSHVCDGEKDCRDGSDEEGCDLACKPGEFQCAHGRMCIDQTQVCDGTPQCQDRSDELDCFKATKSCSHRCDNKTRCIPEGFLCDGEKDCSDGSDEANCVVEACGTDQFLCGNGQCVDQPLRCDGHADCRDHSDEKGCSQPPTCPPPLRCPGSNECLLQEWLCDGDEDCSDGSDERNCKTSLLKCGEMQWACSSKDQCIPQSWRCDGTNDCHDNSDETGCGRVKCPTGKFQCRSGECVDPALVCNGATNCLDGSDEGPGCKSNCTSSGSPRCDHTCVQTPHGLRCACKAGFRLQADGLTCKDVDECAESGPPVCTHICLNSRGSFLCQCNPGFLLEPDGRTCKTPDEPSLLASMQSELVLVGLRSGDKKVLMAPGKKPIFSVDYDWLEQRVYWVSLDEASIKWAAHEQKYLGTLVTGVKSDSIALDWVGRNLYWVDGVAGQILAVRLGPTVVKPENYTVILDEDLEQPRSLALLPQKGLMFWSEIGSAPQIERSGMDGSDRRVVVSKSLSWPVSVTIDLLEERLYWTDERLKCIGSASLTGENIMLLQLPETPSPFSVAVFNGMVYWSDTKRRTIQGASKVNGKNRSVILKRPSQPFGLKVVHPLLQSMTSNPCESLRCSHLCLLAPGPQAVCRCPAGLLLAGDGVTCSPLTDSSSSYLLMLSPTTVTQIYLRGLRGAKGLKKWPEHRALLLPRVNEAVAMDMATQQRLLYLSDAGLDSVSTLKLSGSSLTPTRHLLQLPGDVVTALAVDWVTQNLYWSSRGRPAVHVTSADGRYTTDLLAASGHDIAISIALHPPTGRMCFTATGRAGGRGKAPLHVDCAFMDGANRTLLWADADIPTSLTFSNKGSQLYWADIGKGVIASIGIDGSRYREYKTGPDLIVSFTCTDNILLWVTLDKEVTKMWYSDGFQPKQLWFEVKTNVVEVKAYSRSSQKGGNACSVKNGGCVHLCLARPGGRTCRCSQDHLTTNGSECVPQQQCTVGSKACWDGTCLPSAKFCDRALDCPDGSDEKNCPSDKLAFQPKVGIEKPRRPRPYGYAHPVAMGAGDQHLEVGTCAEERCSGHGACVSRDGEAACECSAGYSGDSCQDAGSSHVGLVLALLLVVGCIVIGVFVVRKRRQDARMPEKATLMTNMEGRSVHMEGFANDLYNADEEEVTPADVTSS
ncbi:low-density lipoprotein receptor-related protein 2-like isoform X2 [Sardina pilchardus]|uniref:low-density lipoprotein receptor-related protein 2-like isoform X2 n=1 Tax=Sardina pilchardus TaxID=27697 RepID=UPI002E1021E5